MGFGVRLLGLGSGDGWDFGIFVRKTRVEVWNRIGFEAGAAFLDFHLFRS